MPESTPWQAGQKVGAGRFTLVKPLGRGGMGEVWLAQDERLNEPVALKFLPSEVRADPVALDDLRRETARSHKLTHPYIVRIHDLHEEADGTAFIVMEYIEGPTLAALRLAQPERVLRWDYLQPLVQQLCAALDYAHGENIIHRDLKPANIMVDSRGRVKLADFGIAAVVSDSMSRVSLRHSTSGTLPYMSPQQLSGKHPQATDDIYALGATLYELLSGKPPFYTGDLTHQVLHEPPEPMEERLAVLGVQNGIPGDAAALVMACLAKEPGQRPRSAQAMAEWLGFESVAKPSMESLAAALFPAAQPSPAAAVEGEPAGQGRAAPAGFGRNLIAVAIVVLVMSGAFWLWKGGHRGVPSNVSGTAQVPVSAPASELKAPAGGLPVRDGLVLYFSFDQSPSGGIVRDESGTGNDGQVVGAKWTAEGRRGGGLVFSGTNCFVLVSNSQSLNPAEVTLAVWIKTAYADRAYRRIFDKNFASGFALSVAGDWMGLAPPSRFRGHVCFDLNHRAINSDQDLSDGRWHHIAATYDGATQRMFVDGVQQGDTHAQTGEVARNKFNLRLGGFEAPDLRYDDPRNSFNGVLDEVMIFNRALSTGEIRQIYEAVGPREAAVSSQDSITYLPTEDETNAVAGTTAALPRSSAFGWIRLFDGKTLSGWSAVDGRDWRVDAEGCVFNQGPTSHLFSPKAYTNLEFKAEIKLSPGADGGMCFRMEYFNGKVHGYEAQAYNGHSVNQLRTGGLYGFGSSLKDTSEQLARDEIWFTQHVIAIGNRIVIKVDDRIAVDFLDTWHIHTSGHLALQHWVPPSNSTTWYRNVMVKPLPADEAAAWAEARRDMPDLAH
jgi:hypothetical protein